MCLYTKMIAPQRAKKDIICYKLFDCPRIDRGILTWRTPFKKYLMIMGTLHTIPENEPLIPKPYYGNLPLKRIEKGFFHAYTIPEEALYHKTSWMTIIRCIIPKGTLYYKSTDKSEICAREIKLEKTIDI